MIGILLLLAGILLLLASLWRAGRIVKSLPKTQTPPHTWLLLFLLIVLVFGYLFLFLSTLGTNAEYTGDIMVDFVLFLAAGFIFIGVMIISRLLKAYEDRANHLAETLKDLHLQMRHQHEQQVELKNTKASLEEKNKQLEELMEDFYTLRITLERKSKSKTIAKENWAIKQKMDVLKQKKKKH